VAATPNRVFRLSDETMDDLRTVADAMIGPQTPRGRPNSLSDAIRLVFRREAEKIRKKTSKKT
jgi:hypothetical protein